MVLGYCDLGKKGAFKISRKTELFLLLLKPVIRLKKREKKSVLA